MSKQASQFQKKVMSLGYRGKEIFKPLNTGWIDERVACVREWIANVFFYTKNGTTIMIDAGYNYERLGEKMGWLDIDPASVKHIFLTHQDTDHVGAVERDSDGLFRNATLYWSKVENRYLTGETHRKVIFGLYQLPMVQTDNPKVLLEDGEVVTIDGIRVEALLVPGHTWGHMVYLVDDAYLFTGDTLWFGADGGYSFINSLAEDNELAMRSLAKLEEKLRERGLTPKIITGHTGWTDDLDFAFAHRDKVCNSLKKQTPHDPTAPYDGYDESEDTEEQARKERLKSCYQAERGESRDGAKYKALSVREFTKAAEVYDSGHAGIYEMCKDDYPPILEELKKEPFTDLLDVGCGTGPMIELLAKEYPDRRYTGLDLTPKMIEVAKAKRLPNAEFFVGDSENLPFADESFDAVICANSFHHYPNPQKFFDGAARVLRPGGRLVLRDYTASKPVLWLMNHTEMPLANLIGHGDVRAYTLEEVRSFCAEAGLKVLTLEKQSKFRLHLVAVKQNGERMNRAMKPDYKNWVPKGMMTGFAAGAATLAAGSAAFAVFGRGKGTKALAAASALGAAGCGAWALWCAYARDKFSYAGERKLSQQIVEGTAEYITLPEGGVGLDVGCGSGALTIACAKRNQQGRMVGCDAWGPEYASFSQEVCEQNAAAEGVENVSFRVGNAKKLPFADETFDAVTSNYVYHNIAGVNKQKLLLETLRVLKKGGTFAIHDIMSKERYGDMQWFCNELRTMGYEQVELIDTTNGKFMSRSEAATMFLTGSAVLYGKK